MTKRPPGRPRTAAVEWDTDAILHWMRNGGTIREIARASGVDESTLRERVRVSPHYAQAREDQAHALFERGIEEALTAEDPAIGRLRAETLLKVASRLAPKVYGDRIEHDHTHRQADMSEQPVTADEWAQAWTERDRPN